jgi:hypothetical protein
MNQASPPAAKPAHVPVSRTSLSTRDRSSVIAVALHSKKTRDAGRDCSHLVHTIYERGWIHTPTPIPMFCMTVCPDSAKSFTPNRPISSSGTGMWGS